ncbi:MAG: UDP-N-acetylmuramate dehydrogenase, partial [Cytophagaceae bacterium]|nr:UDP-N-acetylmuramate dehydrogenase [Cytophagaceae bacterium]
MFQENFSLTSFNTFGLTITCRYYAAFKSIEELVHLLHSPECKQYSMLVLGGGSNVLFTSDYAGVVLHNQMKGIRLIEDRNDTVVLSAAGGEVWHDLVLYAVSNGWGGIENMSLIPGSVGASPVQNIGAYGVELKDVLEYVEALEIASLSVKRFSAAECQFAYRSSFFKKEGKGRYIITDVGLRLQKNPVVNTSYGAIRDVLASKQLTNPGISEVSEAVIQIRKSKLPDPAVLGNAGSFFKNPEISIEAFASLQAKFPSVPSFPGASGGVKVPAGWLIEQCGWKGKRIGNTGAHKDQALVLVNYGGATGAEIAALASDIILSVEKKFNIALEP